MLFISLFYVTSKFFKITLAYIVFLLDNDGLEWQERFNVTKETGFRNSSGIHWSFPKLQISNNPTI